MQGWNKKWDEWVEAPGLVKWSPALVKPDQMLNGKAKGGAGQPGKKRRLDELNDDAFEPSAAYSHAVNLWQIYQYFKKRPRQTLL